jgi:Zn2+/Cd2+-exporting ATPase
VETGGKGNQADTHRRNPQGHYAHRDNARPAEAIAKQAGIDEALGDLLPDQKIEKVREVEQTYGAVAMIADGVSNVPALAAASVGTALGAGGTDTAIETADAALIKDDLLMVAEAIQVGRRTMSIIRFKIPILLAVKAFYLLLAVFGMTSLWLVSSLTRAQPSSL